MARDRQARARLRTRELEKVIFTVRRSKRTWTLASFLHWCQAGRSAGSTTIMNGPVLKAANYGKSGADCACLSADQIMQNSFGLTIGQRYYMGSNHVHQEFFQQANHDSAIAVR